MDKYQRFAYEKINVNEVVKEESEKLESLIKENESIILKQNENYNIIKYVISLTDYCISKVEYLLGDKWLLAEKDDKFQHFIPIDFSNKTSKIKIYIDKDLAEPIEVPLEFLEADKSKYNEKMAVEHREKQTKIVNLQLKSGIDLINVLFKPVNETYSYSIIELYNCVETNREKSYEIMGKYKTQEGFNFHSITGLAFGSYAIILIQYDSKTNIIYKSDYSHIELKNPANNGYPVYWR